MTDSTRYEQYEHALDKARTFYENKIMPNVKENSTLLAKLFIDLVASVYDMGYEDGQRYPVEE